MYEPPKPPKVLRQLPQMVLIAALLSYVALFWIAIVFQLGALVVVFWFVEEPRTNPRRGGASNA